MSCFPSQSHSFVDAQDTAGEGTPSLPHRYQNHPPPEILLKIFRISLPSSDTLDGSMINTPESICRMEYRIKRAIVSVCRLWWNVGISLLYDEIIVRRVEDLAALSRTLIAPGSRAGTFIRKLVVSCFVSFTDTTTFQDTIQRIIGRCPSLSHLFINPSFLPALVGSWPMHLQMRRMYFYDRLLNITHLDWGSSLILSDLADLLEHCPNLMSLRFNTSGDGNPDASVDLTLAAFLPAVSAPIILLNLQELHLVCSDGMSDILYLGSFIKKWFAPSLQRITHVGSRSLFGFDVIMLYWDYGLSLRSLHLDSTGGCSRDSLQGILNACPSLVHLVYVPDRLDEVYTLSHASIMWIDVWVDIRSDRHNLTTAALVPTFMANLPSLLRVRVFDDHLLRPYTSELPTLVPPETAVVDDGREYVYGGFEVKQTGHFVFQKDLGVDFTPWLLGTTDDDESDFEPDTSMADDTSDVGSSSGSDNNSAPGDGSSNDIDAEIEECDAEMREWEADPRLVLAVLTNTQQL